VKGALLVPPDFNTVIGNLKAFFERLALDPPGLPPTPQPAAPPQELEAAAPQEGEPPAPEEKRRDGPKIVAKPGVCPEL